MIQNIVDLQFERNAKEEAYDMYMQHLAWLNNPRFSILREKYGATQGIYIPQPRQMFHKIYTESKFKSEDYGRIRKEEFERLLRS